MKPSDPEPTIQKTARERLAEETAKLAELNGKIASLQSSINAAASATAEVAVAEDALRVHLFEAEISGEVDHGRRKELRDGVWRARGRVKDVQGLEAELTAASAEAAALRASAAALRREIISDEGEKLARRFHQHERLALCYHRAVARLKDGALQQSRFEEDKRSVDELGGRPRNHGDRDAWAALSIHLNGLLGYGEDPASASITRAQIIARADTYAQAGFEFVAALAGDPSATLQDPEV